LVYLKVRVTPGAHSDVLPGWFGDTLRVRVRAAPERGKANDALCQFIARKLGVAPSSVSIAKGAGSRDKLLNIDGLTDEDVRQRLA